MITILLSLKQLCKFQCNGLGQVVIVAIAHVAHGDAFLSRAYETNEGYMIEVTEVYFII